MARRNILGAPSRAPEVRRVQRQFEEWRDNKGGRERIPDRLWRSAAGLCREHSAYRVARWLRLNDLALRERVRRLDASRRRRRKGSSRAFVELVPPTPMPAGGLEYVLEARGVRVRVRGATVAEVAALARALGGEQG